MEGGRERRLERERDSAKRKKVAYHCMFIWFLNCKSMYGAYK